MKSLNILCVCLGLLCVGSAQETQQKTVADRTQAELRAARVMRTLNTAAIAYKTTFPNVGYPPTLNSMSSDADSKDYSDAHAGLIEEALGCKNQPCPFHNYRFAYYKAGDGYVIIGRPQIYGTDSKLSLYSDDKGVIRGTLEDREATAKDLPIDQLLSGASN